MADESKTAGLRTQAFELIKSYTVLDAQDRPSIVYTAPTGAITGTPCTKVTYVYKDATSTIIVKMKEENANWDASWDI